MTGPRKPWLRLWDRTLDLAKAQRLPGDQFKAWINLLMLANREDQNGRLPCLEDIAFSLRTTTEAASDMIDRLHRAKLIDKKGTVIYMHDWDSWQPVEKTNAQRSAEWRASARQALSERSDERSNENNGERSDERSLHAIAPARLKGTGIGIGTGRAKEEQKEEPRKRGTPPEAAFVLPDWVPLETWDEYLKIRRKKRAANTPYALRLIMKALDDLAAEGNDRLAVINQSVRAGWVDVWPLKERNGPSHGKQTNPPVCGKTDSQVDHDKKVKRALEASAAEEHISLAEALKRKGKP